MTPSLFFRQLHTPIDHKGDALAAQIAALNQSGRPEDTFTVDPADFALVPGSPFAYWAGDAVRQLFVKLPKVESGNRVARIGDHPGNKDRYVRIFWEVSPFERNKTRQWLPYQKGGSYSRFYFDTHLVVDWDLERETYYDFYGRRGRSSEHPSNYKFFLRPGLTWPLRTNGLSFRILPAGCILSNKGPAILVYKDYSSELLMLLSIVNSATFEMLVQVQLARTQLAQSYEVGLIQSTPIPSTLESSQDKLATLAREAHDLTRNFDRADETTHAFCLPGLVQHRSASLLEASLALQAESQIAQTRLAAIQTEINNLVFDLYGLENEQLAISNEPEEASPLAAESGENETRLPKDLARHVQNLLLWCTGVAFGRWDVRLALDPSLLPKLQQPFEPLPRCAPGALIGPNGLPAAKDSLAGKAWLRARKNVLDIPPSPSQGEGPGMGVPSQGEAGKGVPWDGILVDDPTHQADIVARVRQVLKLLWPDKADAIEQEACHILGFKSLRHYFRDPRRGFFAFHIKRYSKSRRKAPIYWLLQSERRNYAIWLYYHRLGPMTLFSAGRDYADAKVALEQGRLEELRQGLEALSSSARRRREREIERQQKLVAEVAAFRDQLDAVALAKLPPDLNDGVLISLAPLRKLVPWKEVQKTWEQLVAGQHEWSTMARQMRDTGGQGKVNSE